MIKKIHYIWLGNNLKSPKIKECIKSWKYYFPTWEIIEWNESNLNIDQIAYCKDAYAKQKYAFVSDYFRFWILYNCGGLYFDTDVKVLKDFTPLLRENSMFAGFENKNNVAPGLVLYSNNKKEKLFKEILDIYEKEPFILKNGDLNLKTVVSRFTELLCKYGLRLNDTKQKINNITIFPTEYFCPLNYNTGKLNITSNTYAIHLYEASWRTEEEKQEQMLYRYYYNRYKIKYLARCLSIYKIRGIEEIKRRLIKKLFH